MTSAFPNRVRTLAGPYHSCRSSLLDEAVRGRLRPDQYRLGARIAAVDRAGIILEGGERIDAAAVIDARGAGGNSTRSISAGRNSSASNIGSPRRTASTRPIVMDATVDQGDGYRFVYCLPFARATGCSSRTLIMRPIRASMPRCCDGRIGAYAEAQGWQVAGGRKREESGLLPVAMGGDFDAFWPDDGGAGAGWGCAAASSIRPPAIRCPMRCGSPSLVARQADLAGAARLTLRAEARAAVARARLLPPAQPDAVPRRRAGRALSGARAFLPARSRG